ncbi:hypothetical protein MNBD_PLANCTO02-215 [hydrothermal vent metagenome]|uniref:Efflux transport system, outer membrane factor (OMF) lipoprotein n=1 Tax=hydrothermal vent metagenome TaxID=652676 RepID=A0A3B1DDL2_9ZZZZ
MSQYFKQFLLCLMIPITLVGCWTSHDKLQYLGEASLNYYKDHVSEINYPVEEEPLSENVSFHTNPHQLGDRQKDEVWDLSLVEAVQLAISNNPIIRSSSTFGSPGNPILANGETAPSIYDPAIQETGILFGRRGVEAALADFDARLTASMLWGRNETVQNSRVFRNGLGETLAAETGQFQSALSKTFANGGAVTVGHNWNYTGTNGFAPTELFPSTYIGNLQAQYRLPLLAGSGTEYNRIAGPLNPNFGAISGVSQGVLISRINNDITLADFENNVQNLLKDVEDGYWNLYLRYRFYNTAVSARNSALRSWQEAKAKLDVGGGDANFKPSDEAQARDRYFETRAQAETSLSDIYTAELLLRRLLGLPVNDGKIIRPADEPAAFELVPDWQSSLSQALIERVELRKQKFTIKSLKLQLKAAKSLTRPSLDFNSSYRINGFGDNLISQGTADGVTNKGLRSGYGTLTRGNQTGWNLGLTMTIPVGFRSAKAQVHNYELRLAKARAVLSTQEMEISYELAAAFQQVAEQYKVAQTNFNRGKAALLRKKLFNAEYEAGTATLDLLLRAQASLEEAERAYFSSIVQYNQAITNLEYRKGTLLQYNNIHLKEGGWMPSAYRDAMRRAWARSHALTNNRLRSSSDDFALPKNSRTVEHVVPAVDNKDDHNIEPKTLPPAPAISEEFELEFEDEGKNILRKE